MGGNRGGGGRKCGVMVVLSKWAEGREGGCLKTY